MISTQDVPQQSWNQSRADYSYLWVVFESPTRSEDLYLLISLVLGVVFVGALDAEGLPKDSAPRIVLQLPVQLPVCVAAS